MNPRQGGPGGGADNVPCAAELGCSVLTSPLPMVARVAVAAAGAGSGGGCTSARHQVARAGTRVHEEPRRGTVALKRAVYWAWEGVEDGEGCTGMGTQGPHARRNPPALPLSLGHPIELDGTAKSAQQWLERLHSWDSPKQPVHLCLSLAVESEVPLLDSWRQGLVVYEYTPYLSHV